LLAYERYGERWLEVVSQSAEELDRMKLSDGTSEEFISYTPEAEPFARSGRRLLQERTQKMLEWPEEVLKHEDVEAVHKMRVATRRLRATLDAYQSICDPKSFKKVYRKVTQIADALGAARDTDVMLLNLHAQLEHVKNEEKAGVEWLVERLQTFREQKQLELESFLQRLDEDDLKKQIDLSIVEGAMSRGKS
jgi:CHAD domain-containing protein